ncbi:carboxylesterase family protein [Hypoxylon cercidicola]|nr:carboxylesterase family protein [Hypoxylon cercidicola]
MRPFRLFSALLLCGGAVATAGGGPGGRPGCEPVVFDPDSKVKYRGIRRNGIEVFLNIPYGQGTGGANRFKPPRAFAPRPGSTIDARSYGPACPQPLSNDTAPLAVSSVSEISEDCLNLNVARPSGMHGHHHHRGLLPVLVYIHGGGFWSGQNRELTIAPDGMILESVANGLPIIHVAMNYRLGVFGFAQSDALKSEGSENAGLRDQRLAIEWVRDNIAYFGGDPEKITISGQSSGGLAVGMQIMAYGGAKPAPFQQGICESQALEPGITANFTINAFRLVAEAAGCNASELHTPETIACLRSLDTAAVQGAAESTYVSDIAHNIGDIWLPVVDGDFLPEAPSMLLDTGKFANVTTMMGWCEDDVAYFTDTAIATPEDTRAFVQSYVPTVSPANVDALLSLYPPAEFAPNPAANLSAEFYRASRVFRDILMVCEPVRYAAVLAAAGNTAYLYDWNQTILDPIIAASGGPSGLGVVHTSEFAYVWGNLSHYDLAGNGFAPTPADHALVRRGSRSWSTFVSTGKPGLGGRDTFQGFGPALPAGADGGSDQAWSLFVAGGPDEGFSAVDGPGSKPAVAAQKLRERCKYINSAEIIEQIRF